MTLQQAAKAVGLLAAAYPKTAPTDATVAVFAAGLLDLRAEDLESAVAEWIRTQKWFPTVAELRSLSVEIRRERQAAEDAGRVLKQLTAAHDVSDAKDRAQRDNLSAWLRGDIDKAAFLRAAARIFAEMPPLPPAKAAQEALDRAEEAVREWEAGKGGDAPSRASPGPAAGRQPWHRAGSLFGGGDSRR